MTASVTAVLVGHRDDRGFVQAGFEGLLRAQNALNIDLSIQDHTQHDAALLVQQVEAAAAVSDAVIVHGSRADAAVEDVAARYPEKSFFSAGGHITGPNIWTYALRHYEAAYLAGVLAARTTKSGVVGHLSGVAIPPGLRGRAAFVDGVRATNQDIEVVTGFCGNQDIPALAHEWISAEADRGADVIFTMLNYGRTGAIDACRERGIAQIGNIRDWTLEEPDVFIGSAIADHGWSIERWLEDFVGETLESGRNRQVGLDEPQAVRLARAASISDALNNEIDVRASAIQSGNIKIAERYDGPEFALSV